MKKLSYIAFYGKTFVSKLIKFWTRSKYSHIAVYTQDEKIAGELIEVWPGSKKFLKFKMFWDYSFFRRHKKGTKFELWELEVSEEEYDYCMGQYIGYAIKKIPYDWKAIFGFLFKYKKDSRKGKMCSEGCITPFVEFRKLTNMNPSHQSPQDFIKIIESFGGKNVLTSKVD